MLNIIGTSFTLSYIDPGAGSLLLQLLLGGITGLLVIFKLSWKKLISIFWKKKEEEKRVIQNER